MIVEFNRRLVRIAADSNAPFLDVYEPYADADGELKKSYTADGLHLNEDGYQVWAGQIVELLDQLDFQ